MSLRTKQSNVETRVRAQALLLSTRDELLVLMMTAQNIKMRVRKMKRLMKRVKTVSLVLMALSALVGLFVCTVGNNELSAKIGYIAFLVECISMVAYFSAHNKIIRLEEKRK